MAYEYDVAIVLGTTRTGLTLTAQLYDSTGVDYGAPVATDFSEIGAGNYTWHHSFDDAFRGGVKFLDGATVMAITEINPPAPSAVAIRQEMDANSTDLDAIIGYVDDLEGRLTAGRALLLDNLDDAVSSRLASAGYIAPDNAGIAAIQAQTDQLDFVGSDVKATLDGEMVTVGDKTGYALSSAGVDAILDDPVDGAYTMRQLMRLMASTLFGKATGGGTVTITFRDAGDTKDRIVATVDASGNRSTIVLDAS